MTSGPDSIAVVPPPPGPASGKTPGIVVAALVLSILGLFGITAIIGIILGFVGRGQAKKAGAGVGKATAAIIIGAAWIVLFIIIGIFGSSNSISTAPTASSSSEISEPVVEEPVVEEPVVEEPVVEEPVVGTVSQQNALAKAESYLDLSAFSRSGLIDQLKFEGFTPKDATWGVDNVNVNWNEQAAKKAKSYLDLSAFSRSGLIDQLKFEGFTTKQAEFGVSQTGL